MHSFLLIAILSAIIALPSCAQKSNKKNIELPAVTFTAVVGEKPLDITHLSVKITLTNNTDDTLGFVRMSCSWEDAYILDTKKIFISPGLCDKNFPKLIRILPHQKDERSLSVTPSNTSGLLGTKFRVGFNLVTVKNEREAMDKVAELRKMNNIIWSDTLQIK